MMHANLNSKNSNKYSVSIRPIVEETTRTFTPPFPDTHHQYNRNRYAQQRPAQLGQDTMNPIIRSSFIHIAFSING